MLFINREHETAFIEDRCLIVRLVKLIAAKEPKIRYLFLLMLLKSAI